MRKKCVLIVDDSKTARTVLAKKLMAYDIDVESRESAASAIDYLYENTPDAVFMDYEMPGMDGFQALKIIKSNPNTATIPVMMYTSREGGLELSQARALGAIGVLPKQLAAQDLDKVVRELHLLPDQESLVRGFQETDAQYPPSLHAVDIGAGSDNIEYLTPPPEEEAEAIEYPAETYDESVFLLKRQTRIYQKELSNAEERMRGYVSEELGQLRDEVLHSEEALQKRSQGPAGWLLVGLDLLLLALLGFMLWQQNLRPDHPLGAQRLRHMESQLTAVSEQIDGLQTSLSRPPQAQSPVPKKQEVRRVNIHLLEWAANRGTHFDYGENPYSDQRVAWLSELASHLSEAGFKGTIQLRANYGNFCLSRSETGSLALAPAQMEFADCLFAKQLEQEKSLPGSYQTIGFANFLNTLQSAESRAIEMVIEPDSWGEPAVPYPDPYTVKSVAEWNRLASQNQRILVNLVGQAD